ncbi:MAG: zinc-binding metallopeptidase family protein [Gammaproteobacteria bacterium]
MVTPRENNKDTATKVFNCSVCNQLIFFENVQCVGCGHVLGYLSDVGVVSALEQAGDGEWRALAPEVGSRRYTMCLNYSQEQVCNWMLPTEDSATLCLACRLNQTIPDLSHPENRLRWQRLEAAKRRLVYSLMALALPLLDKQEDPERGLAFAFLADPDRDFQESNAVMTGHVQGLITINSAEADDAVRERRRLDMNEHYRTLLGHLRHESGHYYWERLVRPSDLIEPFRGLFGDERADYDQALQAHHSNGPPADWQMRFVSAYASAHPWEDWAESWAQYLHIVDTLETARQFSLRVVTPAGGASVATPGGVTGYRPPSLEAMIASWLPLTYAINSINRSMGHPDMYPFVLSPRALEKLRFVHQIVSGAAHERGLA